jgi:DNA-binding MarR family transcriptional regulator
LKKPAAKAREPKPKLAQVSTEDSMGYLVRRTYRSFTHALERRLAEHGVSISMWFFLRLLWEGDGRTQKELSDELGLTGATTVSAIDNLEKRGLVKRRRNVEDRRKSNIYLTPAGYALRDQLIHHAAEVNTVALRGFTPEEIAKARDFLERMNDALQDA